MGKPVLIVDESATLEKVVMGGLRHCGLELVEAGGEDVAAAARAATAFDLILTDVDLEQQGCVPARVLTATRGFGMGNGA